MSASLLLRQARRSAGLTQIQLAERLAVSQPAVARLESVDSNPTWDTIISALHATGYSLALRPLQNATAGLDLAQLRERLALSPAERLRLFQTSQRELAGLRSRATRIDD
jgi:transcriptional regulator with XRE-family HTH domain